MSLRTRRNLSLPPGQSAFALIWFKESEGKNFMGGWLSACDCDSCIYLRIAKREAE